MNDEPEPNAYASPTAEDQIHQLAAENPRAVRRANAVGLALWITWLLAVLVAIVSLVG